MKSSDLKVLTLQREALCVNYFFKNKMAIFDAHKVMRDHEVFLRKAKLVCHE